MLSIGHIVRICLVCYLYGYIETLNIADHDDYDQTNLVRIRRQLAVLPNGAQCFKNLDCASGCCLLESCFIGICISEAQTGQVCGLLSSNPWGPPGFLSHSQSDIIGGPGI